MSLHYHQHDARQLRPISRTVDLCGVVACVVVLLLVQYGVRQPAQNRQDMLAQNIRRNEILANREERITEEIRRQTKDYAEIRRQSEVLAARVPETMQEATFLAEVAKLADSHGVRIDGFQPGTQSRWDELQSLEIRVSAHAAYADLCLFLHSLSQQPRLVRVMDMRIGEVSSLRPQHDVRLTLVIFSKQTGAVNRLSSRDRQRSRP